MSLNVGFDNSEGSSTNIEQTNLKENKANFTTTKETNFDDINITDDEKYLKIVCNNNCPNPK